MIVFGYVWAGLMFVTGAANLVFAVAFTLPPADLARLHEQTVAMNEALILGAVRQHELTEAAEELELEPVVRQQIAAAAATPLSSTMPLMASVVGMPAIWRAMSWTSCTNCLHVSMFFFTTAGSGEWNSHASESRPEDAPLVAEELRLE